MWPNTGSGQNSTNSAWEAMDAETIYGIEKCLEARREAEAKEAEKKALLAEIKNAKTCLKC